jgi:hypothetical protein
MQKRYETDPVTGLRLEIIDPSPSPQAAIMSNLGMTDTGSIPDPNQSEIPMVIAPAEPGNPQAAPAGGSPGVSPGQSNQLPFRASFLDKLIHTVAGRSDADLVRAGKTDVVRDRNQRRRNASESAKSAAEDPGGEYMEIPLPGDGSGSKDALQQAGNAVKLLGKLFGAG